MYANSTTFSLCQNRNASPEQCRLIEGEKIDLMRMGKAPGMGKAPAPAPVPAPEIPTETIEELEKMKIELRAKEELIQAQLQQLASDDEASGQDITYSDTE